MPKRARDLKPNFAPVYAAACYPDLASIFQRHGYALAAHGSMARDFDLVAIPWRVHVSFPAAVLDEVKEKLAVTYTTGPTAKNWGRTAYTLHWAFGQCYSDLSFFPDVTRPDTAPMLLRAALRTFDRSLNTTETRIIKRAAKRLGIQWVKQSGAND